MKSNWVTGVILKVHEGGGLVLIWRDPGKKYLHNVSA